MKVVAIENNLSKVTFQGFKPVKDERGRRDFEFNFPFDEDNYDCYLEIFNVEKDKNGNFSVANEVLNSDVKDGKLQLKSGPNKINLSSSYFIDEDTPFAYHYKLVKKHGNKEETIRVEAGEFLKSNDGSIYNLVTQNGSRLSHGGSMKLVIPDNYNVNWQYNKKLFEDKYILKDNNALNKAKNATKHFSNKIGGTLAGIEKGVELGEFDGYSSIISLPIFTDDSLSAHGYWNKNCMQISQSLGNINNYASLQRKMFGKGLNFVSDGAFVNEGLEGIHFANVLKWGEKSPYFNWFKASGLKNGPFLLGVFGKNQDFVSHKLVNSPYKYEQDDKGIVKFSKNKDYDSKKPTYVQIFDNRLVTEEQKKDPKNLIKAYEFLNTSNPYEITTHDDTVINYHFEINPNTYHKNILDLNEYNTLNSDKISLDDIRGTRFVNKYENFELEEKIESNLETWDANTDIAKLNYVYSHSDTETGKNLTARERAERDEIIKRNNCEVQDYVITSGIFWTQKTKDILTLHVAQNLKNLDIKNPKKVYSEITSKINNGVFPKNLNQNLNETIIKNVIDGKYKTDRDFSNESYSEQVKMGLMNYPLDAVELGDNISGVLASPFITKRATSEEQIGVSRYDLYKEGNPHLTNEYKRAYNSAQKIYENEMLSFANDILGRVEENLPEKLSSQSEATTYGKYVLPILTQEIAKFAVIKALEPNAKVFVNSKTGEIGYDYDALKETSLQGLGIVGASPEDEALQLVDKIRKGISNISNRDRKLLADALADSLKGTSTESFALADMIVDKAEAGLDWRIDATKDIADIDGMRNGQNTFDVAKKQVFDFWKKFNEAIYKVNPNAYTVAEVTNEFDNRDTNSKLIKETGMTSIANYSFFFTDTAMMFGKNFSYDAGCMEFPINDYFHKRIYEKMIGKDDYLRSSNLPSLLYSYTFIGNHDKPRALHCFALDMDLFFTDLSNKDNVKYRERAYRVLNAQYLESDKINSKDVENYDMDRVSPKAIAMAETIMRGVGKTNEKFFNDNKKYAEHKNDVFKALALATTKLAKGEYLGKNFNPDAFAVKPFDIVINTVFEQAKLEYKNINKDKEFPIAEKDISSYKSEMFRVIVDPAISKLLGAMKFLVALPGKPTLFSGDDLGATGYEEKTKNIYLSNRGYLHNEWLDKDGFITQHYDELKNVMSLRSKPELDALNNGTPFTLPLQYSKSGKTISAILHQNTDGKMAISLFNTHGIHHQNNEYYSPEKVEISKIELDEIDTEGKIGLKGGLKNGIEFVNANDKNDIYYVRCKDGHYYIEHGDSSPICINDSTMILYHVPKKSQVQYTGSVEYKPAVADVAKAYATV